MWNGRRGINRNQGLKLRDIREESDQCPLGIVRDKGPTKKGWFCIGRISRFSVSLLPLPTQCSTNFFPYRSSAAQTSIPGDPVQRSLLSPNADPSQPSPPTDPARSTAFFPCQDSTAFPSTLRLNEILAQD